MRRRLMHVAFILALAIGVGTVAALASESYRMCGMCAQYGVWDWEYWYFHCYEPPDQECEWT